MRTQKAVNVWQVLEDPRTPRTDWSISDAMAVELARYLEWRRPTRILEIGSGLSTVVLGAYAVRHDAAVVTLEHAWPYYQRTHTALVAFGMDRHVQLRLAGLRPRRFERYPRQALWYDTRLSGRFDFVFVDGPPKDHGRSAVLFAVAEHLRPGWELWLDDALRHHERRCLRVWMERFPSGFFRVRRGDVDGKGVAVLSDASASRPHATHPVLPRLVGELGIVVVANGDPHWPRRAVRCLGRELLYHSYVVVATDGAGSSGPLPAFANDRAKGAADRVPGLPGQALDLLAARQELRYVLHLDDHWSHRTLDETWLPRALQVLDERPDVDRVCLKHRAGSEQPGAPGEAERGFVELGERPFTGEPSLYRAGALLRVAAADRYGGRRRLLPRRLPEAPSRGVTVQLFPGVFRPNGY